MTKVDPATAIDAHVGAHASQWWQIATDIHAHPELGLTEHHASAVLTSVLAEHGFTVSRPVGVLPTAFRADFGNGPLTVALTAEYDALPSLGHACGHNLIAATAVAASCALAEVADALDIRVSVIGCPAEENAGAKIPMVEAGVFDDVHAAVQIHPANRDELCPATLANDTLTVRYTGRAAHASSFPERGVNAYDAVLVANVAIGLLRQQLPSSARVHCLTGPSGPAVNIIPDRTELTVKIRAGDVAALEDVTARVRACLEAGALATGCGIEVTRPLPRFAEIRYDRVLSKVFARSCERFAGADLSYLDAGEGRAYTPGSGRAASTDVGNLSWVVPTIQPMLALQTHGSGNHEAAFTEASASPSARLLLLDGARALARTLATAAVEHRDYFLAAGSPHARRERRAAAAAAGVFDLGVPLMAPPSTH